MVFFRWIHRDVRCRLGFGRVELQKQLLKGLLGSSAFGFEDKVFFQRSMQRCFLRFSLAYFRNSCLLTGHARTVFRTFKLSRHSAKRHAS